MSRVVLHPGRMRQSAAGLFTLRKELLEVVGRLEQGPAPAARHAFPPQHLRQREELLRRVRRTAEALPAEARDLRRRSGMVEESRLLTGPNLGRLTPKQRNWLFPRGQQAINLKRKLEILAKRLGIALPKGFNPKAPHVGRPAQQLLRMVNVRLGHRAVGAFNATIRKRLKTISLPTSWAQLTEYPGNSAGQQKLACWLAANAKQRGLPPLLAVMCAIPESGLSNVPYGDRDSVGFFQIRAGIHPAPPGFGSASGRIQSGAWWHANPEAQWAWFARAAATAAAGSSSRNGSTIDPDRLGRWCIDIERPAAQYEYKYRQAHKQAKDLVERCQQLHGPSSSPSRPGGGNYLYPRGDEAVLLKNKLAVLARRLGVRIPPHFDPNSVTVGVNARALVRAVQKKLGKPVSGGFDVHMRRELRDIPWTPPGSPYASRLLQVARQELRQDREWKYQQLTGTPNQAWCASFVSWALKSAGDPTPFISASVGVWVDAARAGKSGLRIVSAAEARPGDLVAYDWNGGGDFYGSSHIGLISGGDSPRFQTIHGNWGGQMAHSTLTVGGGSGTVDGNRGQVVFIRVEK